MEISRIKFRGLNRPSGEWKYGYLIYTQRRAQIWQTDEFEDVPVPVDEKTVGQFTGLHDKSGKEIYEGDIIVDEYAHWREGKVIECTPDFWYEFIEYGLDTAELEIVGNKFENPELLTEA